MYGYKQPNLVNDLANKIHYSKDGKIAAELLPHAKIHFTNTYCEQMTKLEFGDSAWSAVPSCHYQTITMAGVFVIRPLSI